MPRSSISSTNQISFNHYNIESKSKQYFFEQYIHSLKNKGNGSSTPIQSNSIPSASEITKISSELDHLLKISQDRIRYFEEQSNKLQGWLNNKLIENGGSSRDEKYAKYYSSSRSKVKEEVKTKSEYKSKDTYEPKSDASYYDIDSPGDFKKRKRDSDVESLTDSERGSFVRYKKSEDGSIQVAVTHNGKIRIKKGSNTSPPPPSPSHLNSKLSSQVLSSSNSSSIVNGTSQQTNTNLQNKNSSTANNIRNSSSRNGTPKPAPAKPLKNSIFKKEKKQKKTEIEDTKNSSTTESQSVADAILNGDYSKVKPQNQIPITTFFSYCDQFLRPMTEDDIKFLQNTEDITPYMVIPPLGKHYLGSFSGNDNDLYKKKITNTNLTSEPADFNSTVKQEGEDSEFTPLVDRIFGCLIEEEIVDINTLVSETPDKDEPFIKDFGKIWPKPDIPIIEDRIKQELFDLGIIDDEKIDWNAQEDNEICSKIRELEQELREQVSINEKRKKKLLKISQDWIAYQQFNEVLEDQEKQIESVYNKRLKLSKKKKRPLHKPISENVLSLIQKRKSILKDMSLLFPPENFILTSLAKTFKEES
ncbi:hypothetical protein H8356DRAFT_1647483 [Neocallimastix lanati (nom. inval.)]|uniref:Histone acetyltransferases subunit 3-domain-containing protein n=1 Tax=Neocallimastix californiae TaxID=1754190 RepID=A0A1Y2AGA1_9FUNG|nr:hypothetical protein H8356DRAFT_1647483 [Neocallimastix sp. JGI-2020a]ORY21623.1 hypothetical protein LY90DRAFT_676198 [Neocallimastix californiae]|eukprot:ORY21623.1 hypothetical protein LY90DRAFT_676198 [Neocallimastix californiae]